MGKKNVLTKITSALEQNCFRKHRGSVGGTVLQNLEIGYVV